MLVSHASAWGQWGAPLEQCNERHHLALRFHSETIGSCDGFLRIKKAGKKNISYVSVGPWMDEKSRMQLLATSLVSFRLFQCFSLSFCMLCNSTFPASCHYNNMKCQKRRIIPAVSLAQLEAVSARSVRQTPALTRLPNSFCWPKRFR